MSNVADRLMTLEKTIESIVDSMPASITLASQAQGFEPEMLVTEGSSRQYYNDVLFSKTIDQVIPSC